MDELEKWKILATFNTPDRASIKANRIKDLQMTTNNQVDVLKAQGNAAFSAGDYSAAIKHFTEALALDSSNHVLYSNRSAAFASLKNYDSALIDAMKTIELQPSWSKGWGRKGAALLGQGRLEEARTAYSEGLKLEPNSEQLRKGLESCVTPPSNSNPHPLLNQQFMNAVARNPKIATYLKDPNFIRKMTELQTNPANFAAHMQDPQIMEVFEAMVQANEPAEEAAVPPPPPKKEEEPKQEAPVNEEKNEAAEKRKLSDAQKEKGNEHYKKREFDAALEFYGKALEIDPTNISIINNEAAVLFEQEKYQDCIKKCEDAIEKGREVFADFKIIAKAFGRMGTAFLKLDDLENAIKFFNKSLTEHRTPDILQKLKDTEKLKEERIKAAYHNPQISEEERNKGNDLFKSGNFVEAVKHYTEAIKRDEKDPRNYSNRAACYTKLAAIPEAMKDCEKCIALDPKFIKGYIRKAAVHQFKKEYSDALDVLQEALALDTEEKHHAEIQSLISKNYQEMSMQRGNAEKNPQEALKDPEIAQILGDPVMQSILQQMQSNPNAIMEHMKNPMIGKKLRKLMNAGIIRLA